MTPLKTNQWSILIYMYLYVLIPALTECWLHPITTLTLSSCMWPEHITYFSIWTVITISNYTQIKLQYSKIPWVYFIETPPMFYIFILKHTCVQRCLHPWRPVEALLTDYCLWTHNWVPANLLSLTASIWNTTH